MGLFSSSSLNKSMCYYTKFLHWNNGWRQQQQQSYSANQENEENLNWTKLIDQSINIVPVNKDNILYG